ncbi:SIR2 family protein [Agrobacterium vitis]
MEYLRSRFIQELNDEGNIEIRGLSWTRQEVLENIDPTAFDDLFVQWTDQEKVAAKERVIASLEANGGLDRLRTLSVLIKAGNVVPFVGAGMSFPSGYKGWGDFLLSLLPDAPHVRAEVELLISKFQYEEAAETVCNAIGGEIFSEEIHNRLGSHRKQAQGPVCLMPQLFRHEVLTTNFDYVVSNVYRMYDLPFVREYCGISLNEAPLRLGSEPHCLLRIHGEADSPVGRVLTKQEYDDAYGDTSTPKDILNAIVGTRSLLFLGSSLFSDRTFKALCDIKQSSRTAPPRHYAFLPEPSEGEKNSRRTFLGKANIHPIYYSNSDPNGSIEDLLITLIEGGIEI